MGIISNFQKIYPKFEILLKSIRIKRHSARINYTRKSLSQFHCNFKYRPI